MQKAPYTPVIASLGGVPTVGTDVPIIAVFMFLFIVGAITHMTVLQLNLRKKHKFIISGMIFGFCMARIVASCLRIAWAAHPRHVPLEIAASIFVSAGVVLLFAVNLIFTQRIIRALHPRVGWGKVLGIFFAVVYTLIVITLIMIIIVTVQSYYTLSQNTRRIDRNIQLYGGTYFALVAFLPIPMIVLALLLPRKTPIEKFGTGSFRAKLYIVIAAAALLTLGAAFRTGGNYRTPRPRNQPGWYQSRACFYIFNFLVEVAVVYLYAIVRVDFRFFVPNGASGPGDYSGANQTGSKPARTRGDMVPDDDERESERTLEEKLRLPKADQEAQLENAR